MVNSDNNHFRTSDTPLAAYLISEGFTLIEIDYETDPKRAFMHFALETPGTLKDIETKRQDFYSCKAVGNIVMFDEARRKLARMIRNQLPV